MRGWIIAVAAAGAVGVACAGSPAVAQDYVPYVVYTDQAATTSGSMKELSGSSWGGVQTTGVLGSTPLWYEAHISPLATAGRSLVSLCSDNSVRLSRWSGGIWGTPVTLTGDAGSSSTKVFAAAYELYSGDLLTVYRRGTNTSLYYRTYTNALGGEQTLSLGLAAAPSWMEMAAQPRGDEAVLVVRSGSNLYACVWNGSSWGTPTHLDSAVVTAGRAFAVGYMSRTRKAMVVWSATSGAPKFRVWDGATGIWTATATLPAISGSVAASWVTLATNPAISSDEVLVGMLGSNHALNLNRWSGSAWSANVVAETSITDSAERRVDIGYRPDGAGALAVWHRSGSSVLKYRRWDGVTWGPLSDGPTLGGETFAIRLAPGRDDDQVLMSARSHTALSMSDYMVYSSGGTVSITGTVSGPVGSGGGLSLPAPPAATAGTTDYNIPSSGTQTIAPGSYGDLLTANNCTVNLSAGTYVFRRFVASQNGTVFNCNTAGGSIRMIFTDGPFDGKNSVSITNTGGGKIEVHLLNGNYTTQNNSFGSDVALYVYNGSITIGMNLDFAGVLYASGNITATGNVHMPSSGVWSVSPGPCWGVSWNVAGPGSPVNLGTVAAGQPLGRSALAGRPPPPLVHVSRWREIGPDE